MKTLNFSAIRTRQSPEHTVLSFAARASELQRFAAIERVGRDETGKLNGFQRPQIAGHIREIRDYLDKPEAILPNPIVVRSEEHTSELQSLMRISYAVFCLKKKNKRH